MTLYDREALAERARNLGSLNGLRMVLVTLQPAANPTQAVLEVVFHNTNELANILADIGATPAHARTIFPLSGGHRLRAGAATGQVHVTAVAAGSTPTALRLTVEPIGDYSTYTLHVAFQHIDPVFGELPFKFRPGCFTTDCAPPRSGAAAADEPAIDYLAKDYDSFRHTLIAAMMQRVPDWRATSEADLDQTLIDLFSAAADELSDFQDRVMNEAYLGRARTRVSLARHARLMDYHIHQGNQATTWLALELAPGKDGTLPPGLVAWSGTDPTSGGAQIFVSDRPARLHSLLSRLGLYTWSDAIPSLAAGSTSADLRLASPAQVDADLVRDLFRSGAVPRLLIQEWLNPSTGRAAGRDPLKRQSLELLPGTAAAETVQDPLTGAFLVRVHWLERDRLAHNYCFTVHCPTAGTITDVSQFHANLVAVTHGRPREVEFIDPPAPITTLDQFHIRRPVPERGPWSATCELPDGPLAYRHTDPGGEVPPRSTLKVSVIPPGGGADPWDERASLVHSDDSAEGGDHFVVETDEERRSLIRFGNGRNGLRLPDGARVRCRYQVGVDIAGNVGADTIRRFDGNDVAFHDLTPLARVAFQQLLDQAVVWNPFDVTDGHTPEPAALIIRRVPDAYRARQLRAVTLADYVRRAEELPGVSRAAARYAWTGSWRTVQVAIDPAGSAEIDDALRAQVAAALEAVRLIGEDLEIRPPRFVPLEIHVALCVDPDHWPQDVRAVIVEEFSEGFTTDGRRAFFHPDEWTFGQELHASQIVGRLQAIEGVEHVISVSMKRWNDPTPPSDAIVAVRSNEILRVRNDPDHMEEGFIDFDLRGGRQ